MTAIKKKVHLHVFLTVLGIGLSVYIYITSINIWPILCLSISLAIISMNILVKEYNKLKVAQVIIENQILHIRSAYTLITDNSSKTARSFLDSIDIFISNFGILLDSNIVKFNQRGIQLKAVKVGRDFISLTYGSARQTQTIQLLHGEINSDELKKITEKFCFETGIVPEIIN